MTDLEKVAVSALAPIESSLTSDGYALRVTELPGNELEVAIDALEGACADCLVPESVMVPMLERILTGSGVAVSGVKVRYPSDAGTQ